MRIETPRGINGSATASGEHHAGRRDAGRRWMRVRAVIAELAVGLVSIPGKQFRLPFGFGRLWSHSRGLVDAPKPSHQ